MSFGRQSPSNCVPHHDEYIHGSENAGNSPLPRHDELRPRSMHDGRRGGKVAARVRSLNAVLSSSSSVPALVLPKDEFRDAKSDMESCGSHEDMGKPTGLSGSPAQNLHPLRRKESFRARRQGTLIRTRSNPFVRRDSSAASAGSSPKPSLPLQVPRVARSRSRDTYIHSPSPLRMLPLEALRLRNDDDLLEVSERDLIAAGKGSAKWANLLWNVWAGMKTTLPRQVFVNAVKSKMREQREVGNRREHSVMGRDAEDEPDRVIRASTNRNDSYRCEEAIVNERLVQGSSSPVAPNLQAGLRVDCSGRVLSQPYVDLETERSTENFSVGIPERATFQSPSASRCGNRAVLSSDSATSLRSTSPWPDFDDVGYVPSENDEASPGYSLTSSHSPSKHATAYYPIHLQNQTPTQPTRGKSNHRPLQPTNHPLFTPIESSSSSDSSQVTADGIGNNPGTAIAIRLGDMFDAIIIARGNKPLPAPEVSHISGEDQRDNLQDLQQISAGLMQRTQELLAMRQHARTQDRVAEAEIREGGGQHGRAECDGTQLRSGFGFGHHEHYHHNHRDHNHGQNYSYCHERDRRGECSNRVPLPHRGRSQQQQHQQRELDETTNEGEGDGRATEQEAREEVMCVPALLRLVDSTAKDLGLVLEVDESVPPLQVRRAEAVPLSA